MLTLRNEMVMLLEFLARQLTEYFRLKKKFNLAQF